MVLQANVGLIYCWDLLTRRNEARQSIRCREWKWWRSLHMWICLSNQTQHSELFQSTAMLWHSVTSSLDLETRGAAARAAERSSCFCARWLTVMGYLKFNGAQLSLIPPVLSLLWRVKNSALKRVYGRFCITSDLTFSFQEKALFFFHSQTENSLNNLLFLFIYHLLLLSLLSCLDFD